MGQHLQCAVQYLNRISTGKASLESDKLSFSGDFRLNIPLREIKKVDFAAGELKIIYNDDTVTFYLGELAEKWAKKISSPKKLIEKLGVKTGAKVAVFNISDETFWEQLREKTENILSGTLTDGIELIFIQVESVNELDQIENLRNYILSNGAIWVAIPKGRKDIGVNDVIAAAKSSNLVDVKLVGFSATHSMYKLVIPLAFR